MKRWFFLCQGDLGKKFSLSLSLFLCVSLASVCRKCAWGVLGCAESVRGVCLGVLGCAESVLWVFLGVFKCADKKS